MYNPTSAQGQWFQHRWGQREYPRISLDLCWIKSNISRNLKYDLHSVYGDPVCWDQLVDFADWCEIKPEVFTYANIKNHSVLVDLNKIGCYTVIKIDGIDELCGLVNLGACWKNIKKSIESISGCGAVELATFEHNVHQIDLIYQICKQHQLQLFLSCDNQNDEFGSSVIDQDCKWLYDVKPCYTGIHLVNEQNISTIRDKYCNRNFSTPSKNLWAFKSLRTYMPVSRHRSILQKPMLAKFEPPTEVLHSFNDDYNLTEGIFVTPDKKILWNHKLYTMYMNLLANDWKIDNSYLSQHKNNRFVLEVLLYAEHILKDIIPQTQ